jgi:hypothetical protein
MRLVQLKQAEHRRVALVEEPLLRLLAGADSVYALASAAIHHGQSLSVLVQQSLTTETLPMMLSMPAYRPGIFCRQPIIH